MSTLRERKKKLKIKFLHLKVNVEVHTYSIIAPEASLVDLAHIVSLLKL